MQNVPTKTVLKLETQCCEAALTIVFMTIGSRSVLTVWNRTPVGVVRKEPAAACDCRLDIAFGSWLKSGMVEATFALPRHPQWQLAYRIHHRSGIFGVYDTDSGSNTVGLGLRYFFD